MVKNDYFVIVYKILRHLYDCLKSGNSINWNELQPHSAKFPVDDVYWNYIFLNLYRDSYIDGVVEIPIMGGKPQAKITAR